MMRSLLLLVVALSAPLQAQSIANFDGVPEGMIGPVYSEGGVTLSQLRLVDGGPFADFAIDRAEQDLAGSSWFSGRSVLGFGGYTAGPAAGPQWVKSFRIDIAPPVRSVRFALYDFGTPAGNSIGYDMYDVNGQPLGGSMMSVPGQPGPRELRLTPCEVSGNTPIATVIVRATGPAEAGRMRVALDSVLAVDGACAFVFDEFCRGTDCPCGNASNSGGCANSTGSGAAFFGGGVASISHELLFFSVGPMPAGVAATLVQGSALLGGGSGVSFGDGKRCAGGTIVRLLTRNTGNGGFTVPEQGGPGLAALGHLQTPGERTYQVFYRDAAGPCGTGWNSSTAVRLDWGP